MEIEPLQNVSIPVTVHNHKSEYVHYRFTYQRVAGFVQAPTPSYDTYGTEKQCYNFSTSLLTATLKVTIQTNQSIVRVTKPNGEQVDLPIRSKLVFSVCSPLNGEWHVCVDTGTLTVMVERNDIMDNILKYLRPVANSTHVLTTSNPPPVPFT